MRARVGMLDRMAISISTVRDAGKRQAYRDRFEQQKRQSMLTRGLSTDVVESEMAIYNRELDWRLAAMGCA
jgi:hypothetical protein